MKRVTGRKSEVKKLVCEFVEQTAIELAKRSYAATYCHITGDTHSQLIKQRIAGMIAGTEAAVANVMNNADIEKKLGYMPGHWREVNERVTEAWDAMALGDTAGFIAGGRTTLDTSKWMVGSMVDSSSGSQTQQIIS